MYKDEKSKKWIITKADLKISYGRDECVGEDVMNIKSNHENAVFFFTPFEVLAKYSTITIEDKKLFPEHNLIFNFKGKDYQLIPTGDCFETQEKPISNVEMKAKTDDELIDNIIINNYQLSVKIDKKTPLQLAFIDGIQYATPSLIWAGDLNNDDLLDLILNLPDFYEAQHIFLFLSDKNDIEKPLKKVADFKVVNDC